MATPDTGTPDHVYDLIVTLQRALEDAWRFTHFADDADDADDAAWSRATSRCTLTC